MYSSIGFMLFFCTVHQVFSLDIKHLNGSSALNTIQRSSTYCYQKSQCNSRQRCVANLCQCQPEYQNASGSCVTPPTCGSWCWSNQYDRNRQCSHGSCICQKGYNEDPYTRVCAPECTWDSDCRDSNAFCFHNECKCRAGYRKDATTGTCKTTFCYNDHDCYFNLHDDNTHCSFNKCVCDDHYFLDSDTQICVRQLNPWVWGWACIFVPLAIVICVIYCIRRRRRHCHHSDVHVYRY